MNDLMTKSFISLVELKKQALKDAGVDDAAALDLEAGSGMSRAEEENLAQFFDEISIIQAEMECLNGLLADLRFLHVESRTVHSAKALRGLRDRMDSDATSILRNTQVIKARLGVLDRSNTSNRYLSAHFAEGSPVDRTRISVTNGVRAKLRELMNDFQALREQIVSEHKESLKRRYFNATGEVATEEVIDRMIASGGQVKVLDDSGEPDLEVVERNKAVSDIRRSLTKLHQVFLDMAVMVETQEEQLNVIEDNVVRAKDYVAGGKDQLILANDMKKRKKNCVVCAVVILVFMLVICLIAILNH